MAGVRTKHIEYQASFGLWKKCTDVAEGTERVRSCGVEYLPKLSDEENEAYQGRLNRTCLYNATWRTIVGMLGLLFRRPPVIVVPENVKPLLEDVTLDGVPLTLFAAKVSEQVLTTGRCGIWVNYPRVGPEATRADVERLGIRPSMTLYPAAAIINWRVTRIYNAMVVTLVVLKEYGTERIDEFEEKEVEQYRVLDLYPFEERLVYRVRVIQVKTDSAGKEVENLIEESFPMINGDNLNTIPFFFISPDDTTPDVDVPPLIDLVDVNIAHYQVTADYEHGCHWSGIPTLVITGHQPEAGTRIPVGGGSALCFPSPAAKAEMLEAGKGGYTALEKNLERKEAQMVILGGRLLEIQKPGIEAAETALIHRAGEQSILASMSETISTGITRALQMFSLWANGKGPASCVINKEFFHTDIDSKTITALVDAWQRRGVSFETLFANLKKGGVYLPDADIEVEKAAIQAGMSNLPQPGIGAK